MKICVKTSTRVTEFAAAELKKYLSRMGYPALELTLDVADLSEFGLPAVPDKKLDDQYYIDVNKDGGVILGGNDRSVLLAAYRYLTLIGCSFLRPGSRFEVVPVLTDPAAFSAHEAHTASLRHRGVCLEGACSIDTIMEFIDYLPKAGYNSFFLQFKYPYTFLERYYAHRENPLRTPQPWTMEDSERIMPLFDEAQQDRGLMQHRVGHGWTSLAIGCEATGWDSEERDFTEQERNRIAMVNGKRELFYGVPTNTNLCLSNPDAREAYANGVVEYVKENPSCDYLHLWLADGTNNSCECENCRRDRQGRNLRPSDHYVTLLNRIDERLKEIDSPVKLVMLLYVDLLWAPVVTKPNNPDRFVLMFAPITRTFEKSFEDIKELKDTPAFELNHLKFPPELEYNLRFLKDWQAMTEGCDSFDYDYYMGRAHYSDPTYVNLSRIIARDMKQQKALNLNGISSCQELRAHLPNGLANHIMGQFSLNTALDFDEETLKYYKACYGEDGDKVLALMQSLSDCFHQDFVMRRRGANEPELVNDLMKVDEYLDELFDLCHDHAEPQYNAQVLMWDELLFFIDYTHVFSDMVALRLSNQQEEAARVFDEDYMPLLHVHELSDENLDLYRINEIIGRAIKGPMA